MTRGLKSGSPASTRILIAGCGYVGTAAGRLLHAAGHTVFGVRRQPLALPSAIEPVGLDLLRDDLGSIPPALDVIVWAVSPDSGDVDAYRAAFVDGPGRLLAFLARRGDAIRRAVLVASTSVWSCGEGEEVTETTPCQPDGYRGDHVLRAEAAFAHSGFPSVSLRFGGVYGPGRTGLLERIRRGQGHPPRRAVYGNRIWRDDGARAIVQVVGLDDPEPVYVVVDDEPADLREVYAWLAAQLGVRLPAPRDQPRRGGNKRCRNTRLRETGWAPAMPSYRHGYAALLGGRA
ncbi:MAG: NAD-dependent epimerase/dehydratase family protein [Planctomycetota bacterium]